MPADESGARPRPGTGGDGLAVVDKPAGWTSHDVVARMRKLTGTRRVGHAGTLDPMATGVLVVGVGAATRLLGHLVLTDKAYTATVRLGQSTVTDDADGDVLDQHSAAGVAEESVRTAMDRLVGDIEQVPSSVSAIKVAGQRAYRQVRAGRGVTLRPRPVTVLRFAATGFSRPSPELLDVAVEVECSSGTYVRALARDLGAALGVGGHLTALRRTRVGPFVLAQARTLEQLSADPVTMPLAAAIAAAFPVRVVDAVEARELSFGRTLAPAEIPGVYGAVTETGTAVALLREHGGRARPVLVFKPAGAGSLGDGSG